MERNIAWISQARFAPFLRACDGDEQLAWELYEWNAKVASSLSECFHHTEVLVRNAMMDQLKNTNPLGYPWQRGPVQIVEAANRRRDPSTKVATPDAVISEVTLSFWVHLLDKGPEKEELWRHSLYRAFPGSPGKRDSVHRAVAGMHKLRNRCAHQDSLLEFDAGIELKKLLSLVEWIDPKARTWLESIETVSAVASDRPVTPQHDVVVIGANAESAIAMYEKVAAYVCPAERVFASMDYMGFYCDKKIEPFFPKIKDIVVPTRWNKDEQKMLAASSDPTDQHVARVMGYGLKNGIDTEDQYQVFLLSERRSADTLNRSGDTPIEHTKTGRGSAFVQNKRYLAHSALMAADDTDHLVTDG